MGGGGKGCKYISVEVSRGECSLNFKQLRATTEKIGVFNLRRTSEKKRRKTVLAVLWCNAKIFLLFIIKLLLVSTFTGSSRCKTPDTSFIFINIYWNESFWRTKEERFLKEKSFPQKDWMESGVAITWCERKANLQNWISTKKSGWRERIKLKMKNKNVWHRDELWFVFEIKKQFRKILFGKLRFENFFWNYFNEWRNFFHFFVIAWLLVQSWKISLQSWLRHCLQYAWFERKVMMSTWKNHLQPFGRVFSSKSTTLCYSIDI